jgi:hypothetical protein
VLTQLLRSTELVAKEGDVWHFSQVKVTQDEILSIIAVTRKLQPTNRQTNYMVDSDL